MLPLASPTKQNDFGQVISSFPVSVSLSVDRNKNPGSEILGESNEIMSVKALRYGICGSLKSRSSIVHYWRAQKIIKSSCGGCCKSRDTVVLLCMSHKPSVLSAPQHVHLGFMETQ